MTHATQHTHASVYRQTHSARSVAAEPRRERSRDFTFLLRGRSRSSRSSAPVGRGNPCVSSRHLVPSSPERYSKNGSPRGAIGHSSPLPLLTRQRPRTLHKRQTHAGGTDDCQTERNRAILRRKEREKEAERSTQFVGHGESGEQLVISGPDPGSNHVGAATRGDQFPENQRAQADAQGRFVFRAQRCVCLFRLSGIIVRAYASPPLVSLALAEGENMYGQFRVCGERRTNCMKGVSFSRGWLMGKTMGPPCLGLFGAKREEKANVFRGSNDF